MRKLTHEEKTELLVELLENNEVSTSQTNYILEFLQGNGYVEN